MTDPRHLPALDARAEPPVVCRKLRTKMAFGALVGAQDWRHGESTTAVYWCLVTMEPGGPDGGYVHAHGCRRGRACFVAPLDADLVAAIDDTDGRPTG